MMRPAKLGLHGAKTLVTALNRRYRFAILTRMALRTLAKEILRAGVSRAASLAATKRRRETDGPGHETKRGLLMYCGVHRGRMFKRLADQYHTSWGFEANPDLYELLKRQYLSVPAVRIVHGALAVEAGYAPFYITSNDGASSSMGELRPAWLKQWSNSNNPMARREITVPTLNLHAYCLGQGINWIDDYISDIEGMDLAVLKTMKPFIDERRINTITCEVSRDRERNRHLGLPDNSFQGLEQLLGKHYELVASGEMPLVPGQFDEPPDTAWAFDCQWRRKA